MTTFIRKIIRNFINITYCLLLITYNCAFQILPFNRSPWYDIFLRCREVLRLCKSVLILWKVLIIAFVTSVGGGTVRDLLLDVPVFDA